MNKILNSYKKTFLHFMQFFLLCCLCVIASFVFVFPLFYLATLHKGIYTFLCSFFILSSLVFLITKQVIRSYKTSPRRLFLFLFKIAYIFVFLFSFIFLIINFYRTFAIILFVISFVLYIIVFPLLTKWAET